MPLLIDGYNLMHAAGVVSTRGGRTPLERSRLALLDYIVAARDKSWGDVTAVFDAAGAPPGLPPRLDYHGVDVQFAKGYRDADELIEELIAASTNPRKLTVVSSDHRVQRAAKRRRAQTIDSDVWYERVIAEQSRARRERDEAADSAAEKIGEPGIEYWLAQFVDDSGEDKPAATDAPFSEAYLKEVAEEMENSQRPRTRKRKS